jgi:hypothetical protein
MKMDNKNFYVVFEKVFLEREGKEISVHETLDDAWAALEKKHLEHLKTGEKDIVFEVTKYTIDLDDLVYDDSIEDPLNDESTKTVQELIGDLPISEAYHKALENFDHLLEEEETWSQFESVEDIIDLIGDNRNFTIFNTFEDLRNFVIEACEDEDEDADFSDDEAVAEKLYDIWDFDLDLKKEHELHCSYIYALDNAGYSEFFQFDQKDFESTLRAANDAVVFLYEKLCIRYGGYHSIK